MIVGVLNDLFSLAGYGMICLAFVLLAWLGIDFTLGRK